MRTDIAPHIDVYLRIDEPLYWQFLSVCTRYGVDGPHILNTWAAALMQEWIRLDREEGP